MRAAYPRCEGHKTSAPPLLPTRLSELQVRLQVGRPCRSTHASRGQKRYRTLWAAYLGWQRQKTSDPLLLPAQRLRQVLDKYT